MLGTGYRVGDALELRAGLDLDGDDDGLLARIRGGRAALKHRNRMADWRGWISVRWDFAMDHIVVFSPHEDRSGRAVTLASELASRAGARLTILRVLEEGARWSPQPRAGDGGREIRDLLVDAETRELESLAAPLLARGLQVSFQVSWGVPWEAILSLVDSERCDLVVKPARGLSREGHVFFGSTALHLFRKWPRQKNLWVNSGSGSFPSE